MAGQTGDRGQDPAPHQEPASAHGSMCKPFADAEYIRAQRLSDQKQDLVKLAQDIVAKGVENGPLSERFKFTGVRYLDLVA